MTVRATAPKRATKSLHISFGPIPIACSLYTGSEPTGVKRSEFVKAEGEGGEELHPVGRKAYDKVTGEDVQQSEIFKLIDTENGLVEVTDEEIESFIDFQRETADVVGFLPLDMLSNGHYVTKAVYQVRPQKITSGKKKVANPQVERAFGLILMSMRKKGTFALLKLSLRGAPVYGALLPTGRLYTLSFDEEVREDLPLPDIDATPKELQLMGQIIDSKTSKTPIGITDDTSAKILEYAAHKAKGGEAVTPKEAKQEDSIEDLESLLLGMLGEDDG